jgi:hypothetical protein
MIALWTVYCGEVEIAVGVQEGNFALQGLFDLTHVDLDDWKGVFNCEIEQFACCYFIEADNFSVCRLDDCKDV